MNNREIDARIKNILKTAGIEDYNFEGNCIAEDFLGLTRTELAVRGEEAVPEAAAEKAIAAAEKRILGYPLQYILGQWEFYGMSFKVGKGVLIPRPDTETLVDTVIEHYRTPRANRRILDLCSGSGCIAVALKTHIHGAEVTAVENSAEALPFLTENARLNNAAINIIRGDVMNGALMENFADEENNGEYIKFGCIVSNPPYLTKKEMSELSKEVRREPPEALYGGLDGLQFYRVISRLWSEVLEDGGLMAFEVGYTQSGDVTVIMDNCGFSNIRVIKDCGGRNRVVCGLKNKA